MPLSIEQQKGSPEPEKQRKISPKPAEHEASPKPLKPVKPVATRPVLISAKSVELTESSSEEDDNEAEQLVQTRKKQASKPAKETAPPPSKFTGLKLEHSLPSSKPKKTDIPKEEIATVKEKESSAFIAKEEKKKNKAKKKRQKEEADDKVDIKQTTQAMTATDPFSSSLLDAWLDSPTGDPLVSHTPYSYLSTSTTTVYTIMIYVTRT